MLTDLYSLLWRPGYTTKWSFALDRSTFYFYITNGSYKSLQPLKSLLQTSVNGQRMTQFIGSIWPQLPYMFSFCLTGLLLIFASTDFAENQRPNRYEFCLCFSMKYLKWNSAIFIIVTFSYLLLVSAVGSDRINWQPHYGCSGCTVVFWGKSEQVKSTKNVIFFSPTGWDCYSKLLTMFWNGSQQR